MASEHDDRVRERAYHLWQESGGEHGKEMEHWLAAEVEVSGTASKGSKAGSGTKAGTKSPAADKPTAPKIAVEASAPTATPKASSPVKAGAAKPAEGKAKAGAKTGRPRSGKTPA